MRCKLCRFKGYAIVEDVRILFSEGYNVRTIHRLLELSNFRVSTRQIYIHFSKHDNIMEMRKMSREVRKIERQQRKLPFPRDQVPSFEVLKELA